MKIGGTLAGSLLLLAGLAALRRCWSRGTASEPYRVAAGWLLMLAGVIVFARVWNAVLGTAYALVAFSILAYALLAGGMQVRGVKRPGPAPRMLEPEDRRTDWVRGTAKAFLAIVLSGVAAIGLGLAFAIGMPLDTHDRIVLGGVLVPLLWGGGMAWTLSDAKLVRATLVLAAASAFGYAVAFLPNWIG